MKPEDFNVTQMQWRPELLKLTQVGRPEVNNGEPVALYVDPTAIQKITIEEVYFNLPDGSKGPAVVCTSVFCCHFHCAVLESPEQVALMRDRALGYKPKLTSA